MKKITTTFVMALVGWSVLLFAPAAWAGDEMTTHIEADPTDVDSIESILTAVYDVISGPAGQQRDWDRFRSLFIDEGRLISTSANAPQGAAVMSVEDYIARANDFFVENGFFEIEIGRNVDQYGHVVQAFSAYEAKASLDDAETLFRGVNSFQLLYGQGRWWVVTIFWHQETPDNPIPEDYLF